MLGRELETELAMAAPNMAGIGLTPTDWAIEAASGQATDAAAVFEAGYERIKDKRTLRA